MALTINREAPMQELITPGRRLWVNHAGDALVEDGDPDAHVLFCTETDEVAKDAAERLGFKAKGGGATKERSGGQDKAAGGDDDGGAPEGDELGSDSEGEPESTETPRRRRR